MEVVSEWIVAVAADSILSKASEYHVWLIIGIYSPATDASDVLR